MPTILEQFYNKRLPVDTGLKADDLAREEIERIQTQATRILVAMDMPRRLGDDASDSELAHDKQVCRRTLHALKQQLHMWSEGDESRVAWRAPTRDDEIEGAQLLWTQWWKDHQTYLKQRRQYIATWGLKTEEKKFANRAITRLSQELAHIQHAMR